MPTDLRCMIHPEYTGDGLPPNLFCATCTQIQITRIAEQYLRVEFSTARAQEQRQQCRHWTFRTPDIKHS